MNSNDLSHRESTANEDTRFHQATWGEDEPLLDISSSGNDSRQHGYQEEALTLARVSVWSGLSVLFVVALVMMLFFQEYLASVPWFSRWADRLPRNPELAALRILEYSPVIDGHIDLPMLARHMFANNVSAINLESHMPYHVDIPRLRKGRVGGFFWSVYVECPDAGSDGDAFTLANWRVRDTLEQIDVARLLIDKYPDTFHFAASSADIRNAVRSGKIASLLGIEGGHSLGNSIAALRQFHALGVRYLTLTHTCHNAFADSGGYLQSVEPLHGGLSPFGYRLIDEMNRLGVLVDLSHTSDATAAQAISRTKAPVIWSHSSARAVHDVARNVPDFLLKMIGRGEGQKDGIIMVNFYPRFVAEEGNATVAAIADHVEHIARIAGKAHVGIGSDFDGMDEVPIGLEDVSKYPSLIAELYKRGWGKHDLQSLSGGNLLRVLEGAESVARDLRSAGAQPVLDLYDQRPDLPVEPRRSSEGLWGEFDI